MSSELGSNGSAAKNLARFSNIELDVNTLIQGLYIKNIIVGTVCDYLPNGIYIYAKVLRLVIKTFFT